jgi:hypothetical protein
MNMQHQWKRVKGLILMAGFILMQPFFQAGAVAQEEFSSLEISADQNTCTDRRLNLRFYCENGWKIQQADEAVLVVASSDPMVTLIVARIDSSITLLGQMTKKILDDMKQYRNGYMTEYVTYNDQQFFRVKALAQSDSEKRILDHYFIHEGKLYSILFSVKPKAKWDEHKFLIEKVLQSLKLYNKIQ